MHDLDYMPEFSDEELAVMRPFDGSCRATLLCELRQALPDVYQLDVKRAMKNAIGKLEVMSDEAFDAQSVNVDTYGWEDCE